MPLSRFILRSGPGLLESVYETCLAHELRQREDSTETQVVIPIIYEGLRLDGGYESICSSTSSCWWTKRLKMNRVFKAQVLTYLKLTKLRLGLLINFNVPLIKNGIERVIL